MIKIYTLKKAYMKKRATKKKRAITLIEIMVVMLLIGMIAGTMAYNYKKSLDEGRKFKTQEIMARVEHILNMAIASGDLDIATVGSNEDWKDIIKKSPLVTNPETYLMDAWKAPLTVHAESDGPNGGSHIIAKSKNAERRKI